MKRIPLHRLACLLAAVMLAALCVPAVSADEGDYDEIQSLRIEARQKLKQIRPSSIGQASRIAGVSPADISVLLVYLGSK